MTEKEWLECDDPYLLLKEPVCRGSERKRRLYGCACLRQVKLIHPDYEREQVSEVNGFIETAEQYADCLIGATRLHAAYELARQREWNGCGRGFGHLWAAVHEVLSPKRVMDVSVATFHIAQAAVLSVIMKGATPDTQELRDAEGQKMDTLESELIRHIFGNPFRHYSAPPAWSATARQLAHAVYNGGNCGFALQDALLEAGQPELAEHFREEQSHPKGCWVVDLVLGKE